MPGYEARGARWDEGDKAKKIALAAGQLLVAHMKDHGYSQRELCFSAGIPMASWRRGTGRPYPGDDPTTVSLLSLRDFIAVASELKLDPARVLAEAMEKLT